jgi:hypothetical protein
MRSMLCQLVRALTVVDAFINLTSVKIRAKNIYDNNIINIPYAPGELQMEPET